MLFDDGRLLFFDDHHIESMENITFCLNPPVRRDPCALIENEWERHGVRPFCITPYKDEYRLYYSVNLPGDVRGHAMMISKDGVNWEHPELGVVEFDGSKKNNLIDAENRATSGMCVYVDPTGPDEHRFKLISHSGGEGGMYLMTSPDGLRFKRAEGVLLPFKVDNCVSAFYDPIAEKHRLYLRGWERGRPISGMNASAAVRATTSKRMPRFS